MQIDRRDHEQHNNLTPRKSDKSRRWVGKVTIHWIYRLVPVELIKQVGAEEVLLHIFQPVVENLPIIVYSAAAQFFILYTSKRVIL
jgi:hypothetical protein